MTFATPVFLFAFLPISVLVSLCLKNTKVQNAFLAVASLLFFCFGQLSALPVLMLSVLVNYFAGKIIFKTARHKKAVLVISLVLNIALLCVFKYTGFLFENLNRWFGCGLQIPELLLPIGISFFTFQGISYLIDLYRKDAEPADDFVDFALFIMFFPQFLMGPILQWRDVSTEIRNRSADREDMAIGLRRFCFGLFKNSVIAGSMGRIADTVFNGSVANAAALIDVRLAWLGAVAYAFELYFDFSGYSDMALGLSRVFGFHFKENFSFPYAATSIRDFWRRWHISLSAWFRDYVYFPLGGSRKGKARALLNRMIVFLLTGFWHGANWTFIVWGLLHGALSNLEDIGIIPVKRLERSKAGKAVNYIYTIVAVVVLFAIFRADNLKDGWTITASLFAGGIRSGAGAQLQQLLTPYAVFVLILSAFLAGPIMPLVKNRLEHEEAFTSAGVQIAVYVLALLALILSICYISQGNFSPSIYMQF